LKSLPNDDSHGKLQPIRFLNDSIFASGAREMAANDVSRAARMKDAAREIVE
jgi:hypothetical protein